MAENTGLRSLIIDPTQVDPQIDVTGLRTATDTSPQLLAQAPDFQGVQFDPTSYDYIADLYELYSGGLPMLDTPATTDTAQIPGAADTLVNVGGQSQGTGVTTDPTLDTTFQDAGAVDVPGTIGTLGDLVEPGVTQEQLDAQRDETNQSLIDQGIGVVGADPNVVVAPGEIPLTQEEIDIANLGIDYRAQPTGPALDLSGTSTDLINQGVIETPSEFYDRTYRTSSGASSAPEGIGPTFDVDYESLDNEERAIVDQEYANAYGLAPVPEPATTLTDIVNLAPTVQVGKAIVGALTPEESVSEQLTIDPDTGLFEGGDPGVDAAENEFANIQDTPPTITTADPINTALTLGEGQTFDDIDTVGEQLGAGDDFDTYADPSVDAEENQPYNQDFVTQVSGPVETNQLSMMQEYYNKPIEERIAETTGYNPQDISLAGFDLKEGATPQNVQAVIDILNTVGAVASLGSTEAVKKAAVEIIKREAARKTTKAVIDAATSLQLDDSSEPTLSEADQEFAETGDYDVYSGDTGTTSGPDYSGGVTTGTTFDAEDEGGSDDTSSSSSQDQGETSSDAGFSESRGRDTDVQQSGTTDSGGSSGGGGGKIVCTMMNETYGFGSFRNKIWQKYARDNLTKEHETGYHKIFLPLVKSAETNKIVRKILEHIAVHRTIDIRQESRGKTHMLGRIYRKILEPICYWVGKYAKR